MRQKELNQSDNQKSRRRVATNVSTAALPLPRMVLRNSRDKINDKMR